MVPPRTSPVEDLLRDAEWMRALARRLVSDRDQADDAVQDAWVVALEKQRPDDVPARSWLTGVFRNLARQQWRSERARRQREQSVARDEALPSTADVVERAQAQRGLVDAVLALDEPYRSTILLRYFDDLSAEEIAQQQQVAGSTVRNRISRALAELRAKLERKGGASCALLLAPLAEPNAHEGSLALAAPTTGSMASTAAIGGMAMSVTAKIAVGIIGASVLAWWLWPRPTRDGAVELASSVVSHGGPDLASADDANAPARTAASLPGTEESDVASAAPNQPSGGLASLLVRVTWAEDGSPAAGVGVHAMSWDAPDPFLYAQTGTTSHDGQVLFERIHPGQIMLASVFDDGASVRVEAGLRTEHVLVIPVGVVIEGEVVDAEGRAVPNASIWLSQYANGKNGDEVARSGADGRFRLRSVSPPRCVAARAAGFAPSNSYNIQGNAGETVHPRIVLTARGGSLSGLVRGPDGAPIEGARVQAGRERVHLVKDEEGRTLNSPPSQRTRTERDGRFAFAGVTARDVPIVVRKPGFAPWSGTVQIEAGENEHVAVDLVPDAVVQGVVRDDQGRAVPAVMLGAGSYGNFDSALTRSAADGSYRLEGLPAGSVEVRASLREKGKSSTTLELTNGREHVWNPVLASSGPSVSGRVVDEDGKPLVNWMVGAIGSDNPGTHHRSARTDAAGAFRLENWPAEASWIEVREPDLWTFEAAATLRDFQPGQEGLVIRVPREARATAFLEGRVLGVGGQTIEEGKVWCSAGEERTSFIEDVEAKTGRFQIGPLKPGVYRLRFEAPGRGPRELPLFTLAQDEKRDLGLIELESAGFVRVVLDQPGGSPLSRGAYGALFDAEGRMRTSIEFDDRQEARSGPLAPGSYVVRVTSWEARGEYQTVDVRSGEETSIEVMLQPATSRVIEVELPADFDLSQPVRIVVRDPLGRTACDASMRKQATLPMRILVTGLGVGVHRAEVSTERGAKGSASFEIVDLQPNSESVKIPLR